MDNNTVDVVALFRSALFEASGIKLDNLGLDTPLADLNLDSIAVMETIAVLEDKLHIRIPDEQLAHVSKLRDLEALIARSRPTA